jgi:hypothetical protein
METNEQNTDEQTAPETALVPAAAPAPETKPDVEVCSHVEQVEVAEDEGQEPKKETRRCSAEAVERGRCEDHVVRTAEEHARRLGHLPAYHQDKPPADKPKKVMPRRRNLHHHNYLEAKHANGWPEGKELTRVEYLAGVKAAKKLIFR